MLDLVKATVFWLCIFLLPLGFYLGMKYNQYLNNNPQQIVYYKYA